jgi:hypothetical protein
MITSTIDTASGTIAGVATKTHLLIGTTFSVSKRMGSQVYNSHKFGQ